MFGNLKLIWSAFFFAELGRAMYFIIITWILYSMTEDAFYTGLLIGLGFVPAFILNLLFGVIVDRLDRKFLSVFANSVNTIAIASIMLAILIDIVTPWMIIGIQMVIQLMGSLFRPSIQAFIADIFKKEDLPKVFSQSGSAAIVGGLLGASSGGMMIGFTSESFSMAMVALCFVLATLSLILIKKVSEKKSQRSISNPSFIADLVGGFNYLKSNKFLFSLFGVMFVGQLVFHTSVGFLSVYTKDYLNQTASVYGFLETTFSLGGLTAGFLGTWWWNRNTNYLSFRSLLIIFLGLIIVGFTPILPIAFVGVFLIGLGTTWIRVLLQSVQQMATEKEYHGRMASYRMIFNQGSVVVSAPVFGWIASHYSINSIYLTLLIPVILVIPFSLQQAKHEQFVKYTKKPA